MQAGPGKDRVEPGHWSDLADGEKPMLTQSRAGTRGSERAFPNANGVASSLARLCSAAKRPRCKESKTSDNTSIHPTPQTGADGSYRAMLRTDSPKSKCRKSIANKLKPDQFMPITRESNPIQEDLRGKGDRPVWMKSDTGGNAPRQAKP